MPRARHRLPMHGWHYASVKLSHAPAPPYSQKGGEMVRPVIATRNGVKKGPTLIAIFSDRLWNAASNALTVNDSVAVSTSTPAAKTWSVCSTFSFLSINNFGSGWMASAGKEAGLRIGRLRLIAWSFLNQRHQLRQLFAVTQDRLHQCPVVCSRPARGAVKFIRAEGADVDAVQPF